MRVLVAIAQVPFSRRPTESLAEDLRIAIRHRGHQVEIVRIPFSCKSPEQIFDHVVAARLMDWTGSEAGLGDLLIALEFPAYLIPHPCKVLWLAHDHGWSEAGASAIPHDSRLDACREADRRYLPEMARLFAVSTGVAASLKKRAGLDATPLYPPAREPDLFAWMRSEDFLLVPPFIPAERIELALQALAASSARLEVKIVGLVEAESKSALRTTAERLGIADRVHWLGEVAHSQLAQLYGTAFAVLCPALDESFAWATLQAGLASKAIIVCADSGAPAELVSHRETGVVSAPEPGAIAAAIDDLWRHPQRTMAWGRAGRAATESTEIDWPRVLDQLLDVEALGAAAGSRR